MNSDQAKTAVLASVQKLLHCKYRGAVEWVIAPAVLLGGLAYLAWRYPVTSTVISVVMVCASLEANFR